MRGRQKRSTYRITWMRADTIRKSGLEFLYPCSGICREMTYSIWQSRIASYAAVKLHCHRVTDGRLGEERLGCPVDLFSGPEDVSLRSSGFGRINSAKMGWRACGLRWRLLYLGALSYSCVERGYRRSRQPVPGIHVNPLQPTSLSPLTPEHAIGV